MPILHAQQWEWAIQERVYKFTVDSAGNTYTLSDSTFKRFDSVGNLIWQKQFSGDLIVRSMVADNVGNLYFTGNFTNLTFGGGSFVSYGNKDAFFCKINPSGAMSWNKILGGPADDNSTDLSISNSQKLILCGNAGVAAVIGSTLFTEARFYAARFDTNGNQEMLLSHTGGHAWEVDFDTMGNIYLLGEINVDDTLDFGNGITLYGCGLGCMGTHFLAKFSSSGASLWANDMGGNYYQPNKTLGVDASGNCYLTKWQRYSGFYLDKLDSNGVHQWFHSIGGTYGDCQALCIDNTNNIWLAGDIWIGGFNGQPFVWEIDSFSNLLSSIPATASATGTNISVDGYNNVYVSGTFNDTAVFGSTMLLAGSGGFFLAKMNRGAPLITSTGKSIDMPIVSIFPNPSSGTFAVNLQNKATEAKISIYDEVGNFVTDNVYIKYGDLHIDLPNKPKGVYFIEILTGEQRVTKKIILQ
ncbi:MAG: T9SS type A sorting domain-containing protein [Bacteroidota bacterium]